MHIIIDIVLVVGAFAGGVLFGRRNPKHVEKAVAEIKNIEHKV